MPTVALNDRLYFLVIKTSKAVNPSYSRVKCKVCKESTHLQAAIPHCQHTAIGRPLQPGQVLCLSLKMLEQSQVKENHFV